MSVTEEQIAEEMSPDDNEQGDELEQEEGGQGEPDTEPDAAQEAAPPRSQKEIEELQEKLSREADRHAKRVADIMGDDFALLVPSPVDWTPGFIFNVPEMLPFPEQVAELDALIGRAGAEDFEDAPDAEACSQCHAKGHTKTGSLVDGQRTKPCGKCNGSGWVTKMPPLVSVPQPDYTQNATHGQPISPDVYQVKDSWGRPANHPHFGIDPVSITA